MRDLVADVSSYQGANDWLFYSMKKAGFRAVIIKLTQGSKDGDNYVNPYARQQISLARKHHLLVHAYHFAKFCGATDARNEAKFFVDTAKRLGISRKRVMVVDCEPNGPTGNISTGTRAFIDYVHKHGYKRTAVYGPGSWFTGGQLRQGHIGSKHYWVAAYNSWGPGVNHATMWQFTDRYRVGGWSIDASYDFTGYFSRKPTSPKRVAKKAKKTAKKAVKKVTKTPSLPANVHAERGTFIPNQRLRIWRKPGLDATGYHFNAGEKCRYRGYIHNGNYIYLCYLAKGHKKWHYVACRERSTGKPLGTFK